MNPGLGIRWDDLPRLRGLAAELLYDGPLAGPDLAVELFGLTRAPSAVASRLVREVLGGDPRFETERDRWLLRDAPASIPLDELDFVVVDLETTGGSPAGGDRITELAAVRVRGGAVVEEMESLVNPERPIPRAVTALTNITYDMVAKAPRLADLSARLRAALEGAVFVAHNAEFDWRFLRAELARSPGIRLRGPCLCTLRLARRLHPDLARRSLRAMAHYYDIEFERWHRAGPDARATAQLFLRFLDGLAERGIADWATLQAFLTGDDGRARRERRRKRRKRKDRGRKVRGNGGANGRDGGDGDGARPNGRAAS
jgi:DNA polymerase III epsilon subunit family exonuclease